MDSNQLVEHMKRRSKQLSLSVIKFQKNIPNTITGRVLSKQLIRSATSVAANYRAACRARSKKEFYAKLCITVEEADETLFWLELIHETNLVSQKLIQPIAKETLELVKILSKARKSTAQKYLRKDSQ